MALDHGASGPGSRRPRCCTRCRQAAPRRGRSGGAAAAAAAGCWPGRGSPTWSGGGTCCAPWRGRVRRPRPRSLLCECSAARLLRGAAAPRPAPARRERELGLASAGGAGAGRAPGRYPRAPGATALVLQDAVGARGRAPAPPWRWPTRAWRCFDLVVGRPVRAPGPRRLAAAASEAEERAPRRLTGLMPAQPGGRAAGRQGGPPESWAQAVRLGLEAAAPLPVLRRALLRSAQRGGRGPRAGGQRLSPPAQPFPGELVPPVLR
nr:exosome complex component MTR3 [Chelonoidis abingdonii]